MKATANLLSVQSQIISRGLQFWLEPGLRPSYSGTGTNAFDLTSNRYLCTLERGVGYDATKRVPGFSFDGETSYKYINTGQSLAFASFTLSAWVNPASTVEFGQNLTVFSKENTTGTAYNYKLYLAFGNRVELSIMDSNGNMYFASGGALTANVWSHIVATYDSTTKFAQIITNNNRNTNQNLAITDSILVGDNCWIGCSANTTNNANGLDPFNGLIAQCLIYDRALTLNEVRTIYRSQAPKYRPFN